MVYKDPKLEHLWQKIRNFRFDDPHSAFPFSLRLARENAWTQPFALQAIEEYRRFIFLICASGQSCTPSDEVDQVWHLHMLYTQSYWDDFCEQTLGMKIHHGPTKGGKEQGDLFWDMYRKTCDRYRYYFAEEPPVAFWPSAQIRFSEIHFQRVNTHRYWMIRKPGLLLYIKKMMGRT